MKTQFIELTQPTPSLADMFNKWENDSEMVPLTRPNLNKADLERQWKVTADEIKERLHYQNIYLIYVDGRLVGEMNYMVDPDHLYKKDPGTAWIGITIGEPEGRGKGIGYAAIRYLEEQITRMGLKRIELGVFEFNKQAFNLYKRLGYEEITRIPEFTYWQGKMWADIRMEKYLGNDPAFSGG
ncbi:GNAT family N-acetyltransferase [Halobacillus sp. Marseille-Q1614]|uniref:GNAT family N-acetyltransferase n=1 Tax=Halobacillus sp. Marseille-Q1614 TaxID=2709134 RepID=UPI00156E1E41|nr:GNAT family protein [Halobacillus sp. Marseille-Q1614]